MSAPVRRSRRETAASYRVRIWQAFRERGIPAVVTAAEAHRLAAEYGVDAYKPTDHETAVTLSGIALVIAQHVK